MSANSWVVDSKAPKCRYSINVASFAKTSSMMKSGAFLDKAPMAGYQVENAGLVA